MEFHPPQHLSVVAIEKQAFVSPTIKIANFTYRCTISRMSWVFANGPGDWGSIPSQFISKTQKIVLDFVLLHIQYY